MVETGRAGTGRNRSYARSDALVITIHDATLGDATSTEILNTVAELLDAAETAVDHDGPEVVVPASWGEAHAELFEDGRITARNAPTPPGGVAITVMGEDELAEARTGFESQLDALIDAHNQRLKDMMVTTDG